MPKHELFVSINSDGDLSASLDDAETSHAACKELGPDLPVRTVCLSLDADLPTDDTNEDDVTVVDVHVPPQEPEEGDGEEAPVEEGEEAPAEVHAPAKQPAAEVAAATPYQEGAACHLL